MNQKLKKQLLQMMKRDQRMRKSGNYKRNVDTNNAAYLKEIIKNYGWPTFELVGEEGAFAAWLIVQHADFDLKFQKRCLNLMKQAVKQAQADPTNLAYLIDRVLVNEGKKQTYGTQFNIAGKFGPRPIADVKNLEKRRKAFGLEPFHEYERLMYKLKKSKPLKGKS